MSLTSSDTPTPSAAPLVQDPDAALSFNELWHRLLGRTRGVSLSLSVWGWLLPLLAAVVGGVLRFVRLGEPRSLVFDETYYVKDAYSYLVSGYERQWPDDANTSFTAGITDILLAEPGYVVHPPVGKWMIAAGMGLFGADNSFGWRFGAALTGTLTVLLVGLIAVRLFRSPLLGGIAGLLLAVDGHHLVHSRTSLLDVFLTFWIVAAFGALLLDRDDGRRRLARKTAALAAPAGPAVPAGPAPATPAGPGWLAPGRAAAGYARALQAAGYARALQAAEYARALQYGPLVLWRPWRLAAGVCLGLAVGTKWSALAFVAVFGLMTVLWDVNARRVAGVRGWLTAGLLRDGVPAFFTIIPAAALAYLASWTGWLRSTDAYNRTWAQDNPSETWGWLPDWLRSLAEYHRSAYAFHSGLSSEHTYESSAWTWLFMGRPTSFFYESATEGTAGCAVESCSTAVTSVGNPLIWWAAALSLLVLLFCWIGRRDWRAGAILAGVAAGYLPWFAYPERTTFFFYSVSFEPFLILALVYVLGLILGRPADPLNRRHMGAAVVAIFLLAAVLLSAFFMPVWTAETIPYSDWRLRMWMRSWI